MSRAIIRRDNCLTKLLVTVLGMSPETADPEVHRLEHVLSDEVLTRLESLVSFASSSDAWLKRLHYRITRSTSHPRESQGFAVGQSDIHKGLPREKVRRDKNDKEGAPTD